MNDKDLKLPEAIILCGGKGERLHPITLDIPKPLVNLNDIPIIHYVINHLLKYKICKIHIACGYKSNLMKKHFAENIYSADISIYDSGDVDIIKRIQDILESVHSDVIVLYGDTISNVNINSLILHHKTSSKSLTLATWPLKISYGLVKIADNNTVISFAEKPTLNKWINIGYIYISQSYRNIIFKHDSFEEFLVESANNNSINAYKHYGLHITVNTLSELEEARININSINEE